MKLFLAMLLSVNLFAATALNKNGAYQINRKDRLNRSLSVGTLISGGQWLKAQYSYAIQGGASGDVTLVDDEGLAVKLPSGAIIYDCLIDVLTQPASSTSSGSLAFSSNAVADLKAAAFVASYTTSSRIACLPTGTVGSSVKMSSEATLKVRIGSEALTAGKVNIWVNYVVSE